MCRLDSSSPLAALDLPVTQDAGRDAPRPTVTDLDTEPIHRNPVLNGLINEYTHAA